MGQEQDSDYYDKYYRSKRSRYKLEKAFWYPLWILAAEQIRLQGASRIVDVGCGAGPLARLLPAEVSYTGYDFSPVAIERARKLFDGECDATFVLKDVHSFDGSEFESADAVVICELLEHIEEAQRARAP